MRGIYRTAANSALGKAIRLDFTAGWSLQRHRCGALDRGLALRHLWGSVGRGHPLRQLLAYTLRASRL